MSNINDLFKIRENTLKAIEEIQPQNRLASMKFPEIRNYHLADYQYEIIMDSIKNFEDKLDNNSEVAIKLASFGQTILLNVTDIGYSNPSLIHFHGYVNGQYSELIQHINQLSFLITSAEKDDPSRQPRRIGFITNETTSDSDSE